MTTTDTTTQLTALAAELADVQARINDLGERETALKAAIRDLAPVGTYDAGGIAVTVAVNRRFDPAAFTKAYPVTKYAKFYKLVPDTTLVKRGLSPEDYEAFMAVVGEPKVSLR